MLVCLGKYRKSGTCGTRFDDRHDLKRWKHEYLKDTDHFIPTVWRLKDNKPGLNHLLILK